MSLRNERPGDIALAALGAAQGYYKYYVQPELTAGRAWTALAMGIVAYEVACPDGQLMSQGCHRLLETHPILTRAVIGITALHLAGTLPPKLDPFHLGLKLLKG